MKNKPLLLAFLAFVCSPAFAVLQTGDTVPSVCWTDVYGQSICMDQTVGVVQVLVYNAGYCEPCNEEMAALVPRLKEFNGKPVVFYSLSVADDNGSKPTNAFLKEWQKKYSIPFTVASAPTSQLLQYDAAPGIPMDVIIDQNGKLASMVEGYEQGSIDSLFNKINTLLSGNAPAETFVRFAPFTPLE